MVIDTRPDLAGDKSKLGTYAGFLGSSFFVGQLISSFVWGRLSDKYGRRPIMLAGAFFSFAAVQAFAFSRNYYYALIVRLIAGALNGNLGVIKTYLGEVTDSSNQTKAFSLFSGCQGIAAILGAAAGGYLSRPAVEYPQVFAAAGFFGMFPYFIVNTVASCVLLVGFILALLFLKESHVFHESQDASKLEKSSLIENELEEDDHEHDVLGHRTVQDTVTETKPASSSWSLSSDKVALSTTTMYAALGLLFICYDEIFSTWSVAPVDAGGLDFTPSHLGALGAWGGASIIIIQKWIYPFCTAKLKLLRTFQVGLIMTIPLLLAWPATNFLRRNMDVTAPWYWWIIVGLLYFYRVLVGQLTFTAIIQMVNNSVAPTHMGSVNGYGQSVVAFLRAVGPAAAGTALQHSLELHEQTLFAHFIPWVAMILPINLILLLLSYFKFILPERLNLPFLEFKALFPTRETR
jgi:MFS family permease